MVKYIGLIIENITNISPSYFKWIKIQDKNNESHVNRVDSFLQECVHQYKPIHSKGFWGFSKAKLKNKIRQVFIFTKIPVVVGCECRERELEAEFRRCQRVIKETRPKLPLNLCCYQLARHEGHTEHHTYTPPWCQTCNVITSPSVSHRLTSTKCPIMVSFKF